MKPIVYSSKDSKEAWLVNEDNILQLSGHIVFFGAVFLGDITPIYAAAREVQGIKLPAISGPCRRIDLWLADDAIVASVPARPCGALSVEHAVIKGDLYRLPVWQADLSEESATALLGLSAKMIQVTVATDYDKKLGRRDYTYNVTEDRRVPLNLRDLALASGRGYENWAI